MASASNCNRRGKIALQFRKILTLFVAVTNGIPVILAISSATFSGKPSKVFNPCSKFKFPSTRTRFENLQSRLQFLLEQGGKFWEVLAQLPEFRIVIVRRILRILDPESMGSHLVDVYDQFSQYFEILVHVSTNKMQKY